MSSWTNCKVQIKKKKKRKIKKKEMDCMFAHRRVIQAMKTDSFRKMTIYYWSNKYNIFVHFL